LPVRRWLAFGFGLAEARRNDFAFFFFLAASGHG